MFPREGAIGLRLFSHGSEMTFYGFSSNLEGTTFLRELGIGERTKNIINDMLPWHSLSGEADGVEYEAFCDGLPPSCKLVTEYTYVPKTQAVDTGEFIKVPVTRVVCGSEREAR